MLQKAGIINSIGCKTKFILIGIEYKNKFKLSLKKYKKNNKILRFCNIRLPNFGKMIGKSKKALNKF